MKTRRAQVTVASWFFLTLLIGAASLSAQPTGKIAGKVAEAKTQLPLFYANVVVEGTSLGAASDSVGEFYILNIPVGHHTVMASQVGYASQKITDVEVMSGNTVWLEFILNPTDIQLEEITVSWEKPPVNLQETSARSTVNRETLNELPTQTITEVLELQTGAVRDAAGELHLRGGRAGEISYYLDGMRLDNPLSGESFSLINRDAVEELTVLSGTFNAEYGDAMSGVVQVITREGGEQLHGSVEYVSPMVNSSPYRQSDWVRTGSDAFRNPTTNASLYETPSVLDQPVNMVPLPGRLNLTLNGPLAFDQNTTFFLSSVMRNEDSYLPFGFEQERILQGKLAHTFLKGNKLTLSGGYGWQNYQIYNHQWKYVPDQYQKHFLNDYHLELQFTHPLNKNSFINVLGGWHQQAHDVKIFEAWQDYLDSGYQPADFTFAQWFYDSGDWSDVYQESRTITYSLGANATYQYGKHHQFKAGAEARALDLKMLDIRELEIDSSGQPAGVIDQYHETPNEFSAYIQDKIELSYLVVNAGLRWDYYDPQTESWADPEAPDSSLVTVPARQQFSPRLGLAHPINDRMSLYFAYGHFFQFPRYVNLYLNSTDLNPDTLASRSFDAVGNRLLRPQRTVAYEVGLKGNLTNNLGFTVNAYYKDITDLVGTKQVRVGTQYHYALFRNIDYASVVGIELGLRRTLSDHWSVEGNYAYSVAKGNSSEPLQGFWNAYYEQPEAMQEYYLDFDRRHVLNALLIWDSGPAPSKRLGHKLLADVMLGVTASWTSGLPYTPYTGAGEQLALTNSARMDPNATVDVRLSKRLATLPVKVSLLAYVNNLFNFTNDLVVNTETGEPWEETIESNEIAFDRVHDPSRVGNPRLIQVGIKAEF